MTRKGLLILVPIASALLCTALFPIQGIVTLALSRGVEPVFPGSEVSFIMRNQLFVYELKIPVFFLPMGLACTPHGPTLLDARGVRIESMGGQGANLYAISPDLWNQIELKAGEAVKVRFEGECSFWLPVKYGDLPLFRYTIHEKEYKVADRRYSDDQLRQIFHNFFGYSPLHSLELLRSPEDG